MREQFNLDLNAVVTRETDVSRAQLADLLYANDQEYFRAGAEIEVIEDWRVVRVDGFPDLAAACVLEPPHGKSTPPRLLLERLRALNIAAVRFYCPNTTLQETATPPFDLTREAAYVLDVRTSRVEQPNMDLVVRPLKSDEDPIKVELYSSRNGSPDGKHSNPHHYVALERLKIDAGYMQGFIVEDRGVPAACFGLSVTHNLVRMKNLLTSTKAHGRGCGTAIVHHAIKVAREYGKHHVGVFAIEGGAGQRLYERCGMRRIGIQTEYSAPLAALIRKDQICQN